MVVKPLRNQVVIKPVWISPDQQYHKVDLIEIPETVRHAMTFAGEVLAIGPDCVEVTIADKVLFTPYHGMTIRTDAGATALLIEEADIEAVIPKWPRHIQMVQREVREMAVI